MHCNASSFASADDVRNPNPSVVSRYDIPVTSRFGRSPTARQSIFDPDRAASRWPECCCACRPLSGSGGTNQRAAMHVFQPCTPDHCRLINRAIRSGPTMMGSRSTSHRMLLRRPLPSFFPSHQ